MLSCLCCSGSSVPPRYPRQWKKKLLLHCPLGFLFLPTGVSLSQPLREETVSHKRRRPTRVEAKRKSNAEPIRLS